MYVHTYIYAETYFPLQTKQPKHKTKGDVFEY